MIAYVAKAMAGHHAISAVVAIVAMRRRYPPSAEAYPLASSRGILAKASLDFSVEVSL